MILTIACYRCASENGPEARFCGGCGISLELEECGSCAGLLAPRARFCGRCGAPAPALGGVVTSIAGEQLRTATVLFGFLDGLKAWAEALDPEALKDLLDELFSLLSQTVKRQGGTLDKIMPDGIMVLFGVPQAHEDDPIRGVLAAREMVDAVEAFNRSLFKERGLSVSFKVGLNTGKVLMGYVGIRDGRDFTVLGDTVNVASRLKILAPPGGILVAESTRRLLGNRFPFAPWEAVRLKGKQKPIPVYEVQQGEVATPVIPKLVSLVGRNAELDTLLGLWREVEDREEVRWVTLLGSLGLGKARLLREFSRVVAMSDPAPQILHIEGLPSQEGEASDLMRRLIYALAGVTPEDTYFDEWKKLKALAAEGLGEGAGDLDAIAHALASMAHVPVPGHGSGAALIKLRRFEPLIARVASMARVRPLLVTFSALDEADTLTLDFIEALGRQLPACPVMIVGLGRPAGLNRRRPHWGDDAERHQLLQMRPLERHETRQLLVALMGEDVPLPPEWVEQMHAFTGGNPYYITQTVESLKESALVGESLTVPDSIESVIQSRLDRLSFEDGLTLRAGAVVGHVFWAGAVQAILGSDRSASLKGLIQRDFIRPQSSVGFTGEEAYTFSHQMMAQVAYANLLSDVRRRYHLAAAQWLTERVGGDPGPYQALLAHQLDRGGQTLEAAEAYLEAAEGSLAAFEYREGVRLLERAQDCLEVRGAAPRALRAKLAVARGEVLRGLGRLEESREATQEAAEHFAALGEGGHAARSHLELCRLALLAGDYAQAKRDLQHAQGVLFRLEGEEDTRAHALHLEGELYLCRGEVDRVKAPLDAAESAWRRQGDRAGLAAVLNSRGRYLDRCSDFEGARRCLTEAVHLREVLGETPGLGSSLNNLGSVCEVLGDLAAAQVYHTRSLAIRRRLEDRWGVATTLINQASVFQKQGYFGRARQRLGEARAALEALESRWGVALADGELGQLLWRVGAYEEAVPALSRCISLSTQIGDRILEGDVRSHLGRTYVSLGRLQEAEVELNQALSLGTEAGSPEIEALALMALVELSLVQGDHEAAQDWMAEVEWNEAMAKNPWFHVRLAILGGRVFLALGQYGDALARLEEGIRGADAHGFLPLALRAWLFTAEVSDARGDGDLRWRQPLSLTFEELAARVEDPELLKSLWSDPTLQRHRR